MISMQQVSFAYKKSERSRCLEEVNLDIPQGQVVVLCGTSGCGKTTVTRLITGLVPQYFEGDLWGDVHVGGRDVVVEPVSDTSAFVGSVFQNPRTQFFNVEVESELAFGCENLGWPVEDIDAALARVVDEFSLEEFLDRSLFTLSGGEKQRVACASVSAADPSVVVLDEPTSNLDVRTIGLLATIIVQWKAQGKTVVVAEHRLSYLREVADRFVYFQKGRIVWDKTAAEMRGMSDGELAQWGLRTLDGSTLKRHSAGRCGALTPGGSVSSGGEDALSDENALVIENLELLFPELVEGQGARGISLSDIGIPQGSVVAVIGNNGAGKTCFARCLCGLEKKGKAAIYLDGRMVSDKERRSLCYLVMQEVNHQLFTESVFEELALGLPSAQKDDADALIEEVLSELDLLEFKDCHPLALSGGQKQRVAIASAVVSGRQVMVFDEPTSGLDRLHMEDTARVIRRLRDKGITSFVVTHDPELVLACCTRVLHIEEGSLREAYALDDAGTERAMEFF